ncbi:MAG: L,D-transpeptidase family protein [Chitinispirillia bacterium]|nr:L,D-transpeptidase family protein [Chitinispirillia bacterium]MCL2269398.1 L,D-transpeptidase family protein [Chitinispirillia bacterium]
MRLLDSFNRYLAFKLKEIEFRVNTWKRSREISRAYDTQSTRKQQAISADFYTLKLRVAKAFKVIGAVAVLVLLIFGVSRLAPIVAELAHSNVRGPDGGGKEAASGGADTVLEDMDAMDIPKTVPRDQPDLPADAVLPEAAVLPEGYAEQAATAQPADTTPPVRDLSAASTPPAARSADKLAEVFKAGIPRDASNWLILVDKAAKVMYLFKNEPAGWEVVRAFPVATGEMDGRKVVEGDKKTPQGVYYIVGRKHRTELTNVYGPAAFITDYPNEQDRRERRTGHGIWIHGSDRGNIPPLFTQGCVATSNPDILELSRILKMEWAGVPIVIVSGEEEAKKHLASVDFRALKTRRDEVVKHYGEMQSEFTALVTDWKKAWESRNIETYSDFYLQASFLERGTIKWDAFRARKAGLFNAFTFIGVDLNDIMLTEYTDDVATVIFHQTYRTNQNVAGNTNSKRLIFRKDHGRWKIQREIPFSKEELL